MLTLKPFPHYHHCCTQFYTIVHILRARARQFLKRKQPCLDKQNKEGETVALYIAPEVAFSFPSHNPTNVDPKYLFSLLQAPPFLLCLPFKINRSSNWGQTGLVLPCVSLSCFKNLMEWEFILKVLEPVGGHFRFKTWQQYSALFSNSFYSWILLSRNNLVCFLTINFSQGMLFSAN